MEDQNKKNTGVIFPDGDVSQTPSLVPFASNNSPSNLQALSLDPDGPATGRPVVTAGTAIVQKPAQGFLMRFAKRADVFLAILLIIGSIGLVFGWRTTGGNERSNVNNLYEPTEIPLNDLQLKAEGVTFAPQVVTINGALVLAPSLQPSKATAGQMYYDQTANVLAYYNGSSFVSLSGTGVQSIAGLSGQIGLGNGLSMAGGQLSNAGVLSVQGNTGDVTLTAGNGITINGTTIANKGILSVTSGTPTIVVVNDGSGNITLTGSGAGTVSGPGGTSGSLPVFTGAQTIADSLVSQSGTIVTVNGDLSVTGGVTFSSALPVASGGTGAISLAPNGVLVGQGTGAITSVAAGGSGLCLMSTAGAPAFSACPGGGGGVTSLDALTGALTIANTSGSGATITIDNASTSAKGIAQFNSSNFTVASGVVNTTQDIDATATPTFAGVNTNSISPTAAFTVGVSAQTALLQGSATTITSNGAGNDIILNSADTIELLDNTNVTGNLVASGDVTANGGDITSTGALNITPGGALTVGVGGQNLTLQGNASTSLRATSGANTTVVGFTSPTANTTLNFPALTAGTYTICTTSGNCTGASVTLQAAYDNSTSPEIVVDATRGALTIRDASSPLGANLLEVQNNAGTTTYLGVTSAGIAVTGTATVSGNINSSGGSLQTGGTSRIDGSGNLTNIGSLTLSGAISGGTTYSGSGNINTTGGVIQTNSTTRIDNSGNLINIAAITASGNATLQGGTVTLGTTTQAGSVVIHDGSSNTGTLQTAALGQNTTYNLPDPGTGTVTICVTTGNCAGSGGGVTTSGGTTNRLAKFTGVQAIGDSSISDTGTAVTTSGDLVIQGGDATIGVASSQTGSLNFAHSGSSFLGSITQGALTGNRTYTLPDENGTFCLQNSSACGFAPTSGSANYIQNQAASDQIADFRVSGAGRAGTLNATTAINTGAGAGTQRIDASGNLSNIGNIALSGTISGGTTISGSGNINTTGGGLQTNSVTRVDNSGNLINIAAITASGNATLQGGSVTLGTTSQAGGVVIYDGSSNTGTVQTAALGQNTTYNLPDPGTGAVTICVSTGNCAGSGSGVTSGGGTSNRLAKFTTGQNIENSTITDDATTVTTSVDLTIQGGDVTVGTSSQLASFILHDGNGQTTTLRAGNSSSDLTFILPTNAGSANQCLKQSGTGNQLVWDPCDGGGGGSSTTLQEAYDNGNTINTDASGNIAFTLNNQDFAVQTAAGATGSTSFSLINGSNATPAAQLVLISNNDVDEGVANGLTINSAAGGITDGLDVSDAELTNAINIGQNDILSDGVSLSTAELNLLNGHDVALVDTNDAVTTAITGTGALTAGSIGSGFGAISTGNNIATTAAIQGGTATITGSTALTLGTASANTGAIAFKGSGGTGTLTLSGPTAPNTGNFTLSLPAIAGNASVCTTDSVCSGYQAAGSFANTALSNLSGVAINTSLLPGTTTIDLGSGTAPFRDLYLGGTSTNNFRFTGTAGAARTIILDDLSGGLALVQTAGGSSAQTGDLNVSGTLIAGTALQGTLVGSASGAGASGGVSFRSGNTTGGTGLSTGAVTLKSGDGSGTNSSSGNLTIDAGSFTGSGTAGTISIGGTSTSALTLGRNGLTTSNAGALTVAQALTANGGITVAANQNVILQNGTGVLGQTFANSAASSAQTLSVTNSNSGASSVAVNGHQITLVGTATSGGTNSNSAFSFVNPVAAANNNFYGLNFAGTGYTDILRVGGTQIISGSGVLQNAGLSSSVNYSNITQVGTLTSGSLGSGFTTVAVGQGGTGATTFASNGVLYGNGTGAIQATIAGTNGQCLVGNTSAAPSWATCTGLVTLQNAYANGNTISTTGNDVAFTLNSSQNFTVGTAAGATGSTTFSLADGSNATPPLQLVQIINNDINQPLANGIRINSAAGGIVDGLDVSDAEIDNAINIGGNAIAGTTFNVSAAGAVTAVGVNSGTGQIQGTGGLAVNGAAIDLNVNSNFATNINTGTSNGTVTIGGGSAPLVINSTNFGVTSGGAVSGVTGYAQASGNFLQSGTGTFGTGSGAVSLNGNTTIDATKTLTVTSGLTSLTGNTTGDALNVSNSTSTGNIAVFNDNSTAVLTLANGGSALFRNETNSATSFRVQNATGADTLFTVDTAARSASGGNLVKIGNSTGTDTDTTFLVLDGSTTDPTTNIAALNGGMFYDSDDHKVKLIENGQVKIICNTTDLGCGTGTVTLQSAYGNGNTINTTDGRNIAFNLTDQTTDPNFLIDLQCDTSCSTNGKFAVQDDGSDIFTILPAAGGITVGDNTLSTPVTINSGTGTIAVGTGAQARTINLGTGGAVQTVTVGSTTSTSSLLLQAGTGNLQVQTQGGTLGVGNNAVAQTLQIGNTTGATAVTIDSGTGTIALGTGAQARTINLGTGAAAQTVTVGSTSGASTLTLQSGTGNLNITTQGTGSLNIGNNAVAQTINIGNSTGATAVSVLCGTGTCGFGNNAIAHTTTLGSSTGTATTNLQAGTGGLALTSGANIVLGTSNTTGTLLVLDDKTDSGDPTGVVGGMYYNSNIGKFRCFEYDKTNGTTGYWRDCMATARTGYYQVNEMITAVDDAYTNFECGGAGCGQDEDEFPSVGHPGVVETAVGTAATGWYYIGNRSTQPQEFLLGQGDYWRYETAIKIPTNSAVSTSSQRYIIRAGFYDGDPSNVTDSGGTDGCYMRYSDNLNSAKWQGVCRQGGTESTCDTGSATVATDNWYRLSIAVNSAGTSADFQVATNGGLTTVGCQVTTNIPTGSTQYTGWANTMVKTVGTTNVWIHQDYIEIQGQFGTSR